MPARLAAGRGACRALIMSRRSEHCRRTQHDTKRVAVSEGCFQALVHLGKQFHTSKAHVHRVIVGAVVDKEGGGAPVGGQAGSSTANYGAECHSCTKKTK